MSTEAERDEDREWVRMDRETAEEIAHSEVYLAWARKQEPPLTSEEAEVAVLAFAEGWRGARRPHGAETSCTLCERPEGSVAPSCTCWCHPDFIEDPDPSDAEVKAALEAYWGVWEGWGLSQVQQMGLALRAAAIVRLTTGDVATRYEQQDDAKCAQAWLGYYQPGMTLYEGEAFKAGWAACREESNSGRQ